MPRPSLPPGSSPGKQCVYLSNIEGRKEMFHLTMHSKHFIWCRNIRQRTTQTKSVREPAVTTTWAGLLRESVRKPAVTTTWAGLLRESVREPAVTTTWAGLLRESVREPAVTTTWAGLLRENVREPAVTTTWAGLLRESVREPAVTTTWAGLLRESVREPAVTTTWAILSDTAQVSVLTCTFRARCCSAHLSWAQVLDFAGSSVWDRLSD